MTVPCSSGRHDVRGAHRGPDRPGVRAPVVHVPDASRAAAVAGSLLAPGAGRDEYLGRLRAAQERQAPDHRARTEGARLLPIEDARRARRASPSARAGPRAEFTGVRALADVPIEDLVPYVDWTPLFSAWGLPGRYPGSSRTRASARRRGDSTTTPAAPSTPSRRQAPRGPRRVRVLPAARVATTGGLRRRGAPPAGRPAPRAAPAGRPGQRGPLPVARRLRGAPRRRRSRHVGASRSASTARTTSRESTSPPRRLRRDPPPRARRPPRGGAGRAPARQARGAWGYGRDEALSPTISTSAATAASGRAGLPVPDHTEKRRFLALLDAGRTCGVSLTETCALLPASAICGLLLAHPAAGTSRSAAFGRDQAADSPAARHGPRLRRALAAPHLA